LTDAISETATGDSTDPNLAAARNYQRKAQFLTDFIEAENSMGFHADQEAARILAKAINFARLGQAALDGRALPKTSGPRVPPPQTVTPSAR
jgi:nitrite reductase (cytochrome c-552)